MSSSLAPHYLPGRRTRPTNLRPQAVLAARPRPRVSAPMRRYLPLALLVTTLVTVLPALLVAAAAPRGGPLLSAVSGAAAVALSIALATAAAALWKRRAQSRDVLFADLLLWGWVRRSWTEARLSRAHELYESASAAGPRVSIELLTRL